MTMKLHELAGLLRNLPEDGMTDEGFDDSDLTECIQNIAEFLNNLPDLSAWDLRAWVDFHGESSQYNSSQLRQLVMEHAIAFLLGYGDTYFDAYIKFSETAKSIQRTTS